MRLSWVADGENVFVLAIADKDEDVRKEIALNKKLDEAKRQLSIDALTGVGSATAYAKLVAALDRQIKDDTVNKFAIVECDINSLKDVNDACGHDVGDVYLKNSAFAISCIFKNSPIFRTGGDEFIVILKGHDYENRMVLVEELQSKVTTPEEAIKVIGPIPSIAVGMSEFLPGQDKSCIDVFRRADTEMYKNKTILKSNGNSNSGARISYMTFGRR